ARVGLGESLYETAAFAGVAGIGDGRVACGKPLLLLELDALPRWVAEHDVEATPLAPEHLWEGQLPGEEAVQGREPLDLATPVLVEHPGFQPPPHRACSDRQRRPFYLPPNERRTQGIVGELLPSQALVLQ